MPFKIRAPTSYTFWTQSHCSIETPSDTFTNLNRNTVRKLNFKPALPLSTKRSLYYNKENLPEQPKEELNNLESIILTQSNISTTSCSIDVEENVEEIASKSPVVTNDDACYTSPETTKYNYDTSLYHSIRETTVVPETSHSSFSIRNSDSFANNSLTPKQLECQPLDDQPNHTALELSPAANRNNFVIRARSPIHHIPVGFVQDGEFKRPINSSSSVCVKCANENYISVKGINYNILNTLGHGGSSIVYEVNICL